MQKKTYYFWLVLLAVISSSSLFLFYAKDFPVPVSRAEKLISQATDKASSLPEKKGQSNVLPVDNKKEISILFLGDLMFDRYIRQVAEKKGNDYIFQEVKNILLQNDLVVANLEGPVSDFSSKSVNTVSGEKGHMLFTFPSGLPKTLNSNNIKIVNIGNNHIGNFGVEGIGQTKKYLNESGIEFFGYTGIGEQNDVLISEVEGWKVGFVNYNQFASGSMEAAKKNIEEMKGRVHFLVLYAHWDAEYKIMAKESTVNLAHQFIDEGVDLIIGTHPHVIQQEEEYRGKMIYYSLGNFIFDQYFSPETKRGMGVRIRLSEKNSGVTLEEIFFRLENNGQAVPDKL